MNHSIYLIIFATAPGLIWLFYFLRKDAHPEPKRMIITVFLLGMVIAPLAALVECLPEGLAGGCTLSDFFSKHFPKPFDSFLYFLIVVALIEETAKYLVVKMKVLKNQELDEPVDIILYMIIAALGFATLENILLFFSPEIFAYTIEESFALASFRFISATFLHALCSGVIGFFIALSFYEPKRRGILFFTGFSIAVLLHALYNFSIINMEGTARFGALLAILSGLAIFISLGIKKLKKLKSVCKI